MIEPHSTGSCPVTRRMSEMRVTASRRLTAGVTAGDEFVDIAPGGLHHTPPPPPVFAAAFISRLCSRTLASESGETMSATLRYEPSSP